MQLVSEKTLRLNAAFFGEYLMLIHLITPLFSPAS